mmetsp:Transcript_29383/g.33549  ORF Transcript_29383/g.33549 Transcript_29383/m.33549 type:complete len:100 (-) Transcript_29383:142-441(-)
MVDIEDVRSIVWYSMNGVLLLLILVLFSKWYIEQRRKSRLSINPPVIASRSISEDLSFHRPNINPSAEELQNSRSIQMSDSSKSAVEQEENESNYSQLK